MIHNPQRLRIVATLAALPDGDTLSASLLQTMIGLPPGSPIIGLSELGHAGYVRTETPGGGTSQTTVALTSRGRAALGHYTAALAQLPREPRTHQHRACAPATPTGMPPRRPWLSTSRKAG